MITQKQAVAGIDFNTIGLLTGMMVIVAISQKTGMFQYVAIKSAKAVKDDPWGILVMLSVVTAVASALIDNIPFMVTMIPLVENMAPTFGGEDALVPLWWALALGACLSGNGSLIGASENLIVAGFAQRAGHPIMFLQFMKHAFGLMLLSIAIAHIYLYLRYLN